MLIEKGFLYTQLFFLDFLSLKNSFFDLKSGKILSRTDLDLKIGPLLPFLGISLSPFLLSRLLITSSKESFDMFPPPYKLIDIAYRMTDAKRDVIK